jgi:hypothetical protein
VSARERRQLAAYFKAWGEATNERGRANEARLLAAVLSLRAGASWLRDARAATPEEDAAGADVVVTADVGALYLQSKSSRAGVAKFGGKARAIRVEAVVVSLDDATTAARALGALLALRAEAMRPKPRPVVVEVKPAPKVTPAQAAKALRKLGHAFACIAKFERKQLSERQHAEERRAARIKRHFRRHPNDKQPPAPAPLPLDEQARRAATRAAQREALHNGSGPRRCPFCGVRVHAPTAWRRVEDGAYVCEECCSGLEAMVPAESARAA